MAGTWGGSSDSFVHGRILWAALTLRVFAEWLLYGAVERAARKRKWARRHLYGEAQREVFDQPRCPSAAQLLRDLRRAPRKITALAHRARCCCFVQVGVLQESSRSVRSPFCCADWFVRRPTNKTFPFSSTRGVRRANESPRTNTFSGCFNAKTPYRVSSSRFGDLRN